MSFHAVGIDLSLTNSGVAVLRDDRPVRVRNVRSSPASKTPSLLDRRNRLQTIAAHVVTHALDGYDPETDDVPVFAIEAPLYRAPMKRGTDGQLRPVAGGGHAHDRAGLWWLVVHLLFKHGLVVEVATSSMKRYASGSGSGRKAGVLAAMPHMFPELFVDDDNAADALALAAMCARALGFPVEPSVQRVTPAALDAVTWPTNTQRRNHDGR